jgi:Calcineurin-like phosphoesterase
MRELNNGIFEIDEMDNIMLIGDIHGDYQVFLHCLIDLCECCYISNIKNNIEHVSWKENNNSIVIFCGDIIHRQRYIDNILDDECSDILLLKTILRLQKEANENGGKVIIISGNHEIMNIINPDDNRYTSPFNIDRNKKYFTNNNFVNYYISQSYAWIKINDILISHGGLCSNYLNYITTDKINGQDIVAYINTKYKEFFKDYVIDKNKNVDSIEGYNLFIKEHLPFSNKSNIFWCRQWGFESDCNLLRISLNKINCNKMIMAHCPQFLNPKKQQMINFKCYDDTNNYYRIACIDLGMSRSFDNNSPDLFYKYLQYNFNRKMAILKLKYNDDKLYFDDTCIITKKLSCIQYLLIKYGITKEEWQQYGIKSNWLGFDKIQKLTDNECVDETTELTPENIIKCLLYPVICKKEKLKSITEFKNLF